MPSSDADRFAELIEIDPLRHPDAGGIPGAPVFGNDRHDGETGELFALVSALRAMDFDVAPSDLTRGRQRQRLVAMAAVRTGEVPASLASGRHRAEDSEKVGIWPELLAWLRHAQSGRRLIAGLAGLSVIVAALAVLALLAQSAIPGDTLYALKRGTEQARLMLAGGEQAEGRVLLGLASVRLDELSALMDEPVAMNTAGSGIQAAEGGSVAELLVSTMETMDRQTTDGTNALTTAAVNDRSLPTLQFIGEWGVDQFTTLDDLNRRMPQEARTRAEESKDLLQRVVERLELLARAIDCRRSGDVRSDDLGPLPSPRCSESNDPGSTSASGPTDVSDSSTATPSASSEPAGSPAPGPSPDPTVPDPTTASPPGESERTTTQPTEIPLPIPIPIPFPPIPTFPTQSAGPAEPSAPLPPLPDPSPNEGEPCTLIGFLGIEIPGIIIGGVCVGLGG